MVFIQGEGIVHSFVCSVLLLVLSFFILLANRKIDSQWIKTFGYTIMALLWVCAALVFGRGINRGQPCPCPMMAGGMKNMPPAYEKMPRPDKPECQEMRGKMGGNMEKMAPPDRGPAVQEERQN